MTIERRSLVLAAIFVCCWGVLSARTRSAPLPSREPLSGLPMTIGGWQGRPGPQLDSRVLALLGTDDHLNRIYVDGTGRSTALYIGFHASQRQGDSIHSPMNCLPGAGWSPVRVGRLQVADSHKAPPAAVVVNRIVVQKGDDRQLVLYWYQAQGRVVASEYAAKVYLFLDAVTRARTDAALVRLVAPIDATPNGEEQAEHVAATFAADLLPLLDPHLPK